MQPNLNQTASSIPGAVQVYVEEHDLTLQLPKRWIVKSVKHQRRSRKEVRLRFQDLSGRNAHGFMWILNDPEIDYFTVDNYALNTRKNLVNQYSYASSVARMKWQSLNIDGHYIHGWHTKVTVLGNFRDMVLLYARSAGARGLDKWLIVAIQNQGSYKPLDLEKDIKDIATPIFTSFLDGPIDSEQVEK